MDVYLGKLRTAPPAPGQERVLYPGLNAHEVELDRRANGIPYHPEVLEWFAGLADEHSIPSRLPTVRRRRSDPDETEAFSRKKGAQSADRLCPGEAVRVHVYSKP